jgi:hypothetical protein
VAKNGNNDQDNNNVLEMPTELTLQYHEICNILAITMLQYILIPSMEEKYSHKNTLKV